MARVFPTLGTLRKFIADLNFPGDFFSFENLPGFLDSIYIVSYDFYFENDEYDLEMRLAFEGELSVGIPGLDEVFVFVVGSNIPGFTFLNTHLHIGHDSYFSIEQIRFAIRFYKEYLKPASFDGTEPDNEFVEIFIDGSITIDKYFDLNIEFSDAVELTPAMIGESGFIIAAEGVNFDFSRTQSNQEVIDAGYQNDFIGVFIQHARLKAPDDFATFFPEEINVMNCVIGNGGFSGKLNFMWSPEYSPDNNNFIGDGAGTLFGIPIAIQIVDLEWKKNIFIKSTIQALMILPFFDQPVKVDIAIANDGDFFVAISSAQDIPQEILDVKKSKTPTEDSGLFTLTKEDLLEIQLKSIAFEKRDNLFSIALGGKIKPLFGGLDWPEVDIKALTIDSEGNVKVDGGWIEIPKQAALDFNGFKLEVTKIGFGKEEDGSKWIGLSGAITIVDALPMRGGVEGLKLIWTPDDRFRMEIGGISVAFEIEDVLSFAGKVYFIDELGVKGFKGGIKIIFQALNDMSIEGQFIAGRKVDSPQFNFFYMYVSVDLPVGILLGSTGAALFGFKGLGGVNVKPNKQGEEEWFENDDGSPGFYLRPPVGITDVEKWTYEKDSYAFGAGLVLGTASDNGYTFSGSVLMIILVPGPLILIEGKGNFLKKRSELNDDPFLRMLAVIDGNAGTLLFNCAAQYKYKDDGSVISVTGGTEVFFNFNNPDVWHLYLGQKAPESKRIKAKIFNLLDANAYLMIDNSSFEMGVWAGLNKSWTFGPLSVKLSAWLESVLGMSFEPVQAWASITISGNVKLKACGIGVGLSLYTHLACTTPNPWYLGGEFRVKMNLPWPLPDPKATVKLEWKEDVAPPFPEAIGDLGVEHLKVSEKWLLKDIAIDGAVKEDSPVVPLDARPVINFTKAVEDTIFIGGSDINNPAPEAVDKYQYKYKLVKVKLSKMAKQGPSAWVRVSEKGTDDNYNENNLFGEWLVSSGVTGDPEGKIKPSNTKLMIWANTPFDIMREIGNNYSMVYQIMEQRQDSYPCHLNPELKELCIDFSNFKQNDYAPVLFYENHTFFCELHKIVSSSGNGGKAYLSLSERYDEKEYEIKDFLMPEPSSLFEDIYKNDNVNEYKGPLIIILPENMYRLSLSFLDEWKGALYALDHNQEILDSKEMEGEPSSCEYELKNNNIHAILLFGNFRLTGICSISMEDYEAYEFNNRTVNHKREAVEERWGEHVGAILEPMHYYKLEVETETWRKKGSGSWQSRSHTKSAYFQTENPPGCFIPAVPAVHSTDDPDVAGEEEQVNVETDLYPTGGALKDLSVYIKETIPKQAASNEAQVPYYRSYDIGVKFNESDKVELSRGYIERMYYDAGLPLSIHLVDNNNKPVLDKDGNELIFDNPWSENKENYLTREELQWGYTLNSNCGFDINLEEENCFEELLANSIELALEPKTLYKAKLMAGSLYTVYQFNFITSRYTTFIHHIHSFSNKLWDYYKLEKGPKIEAGWLNQMISDKNFDEINRIFYLGIRDYPDDFEITLLNDEYNSYGLLLESPEPIDWERVKRKLYHNSCTDKINEHTSDIKLIDARFNGTESMPDNEEYIDILLKEKCDLSDYRVLYKRVDEVEFSEYYIFCKRDEIYQAGTIIRIHSGRERAYNEDAEYASKEVKHLYRKDTPVGMNNCILEHNTTIVRIVDNSGNILHERDFITHSSSAPLGHYLVHNNDCTKAFLFINDGDNLYSALKEGRYRLDFIFRRKYKELMTLKRLKSSKPEITYIEFEITQLLPE